MRERERERREEREASYGSTSPYPDQLHVGETRGAHICFSNANSMKVAQENLLLTTVLGHRLAEI